MNRLDRLAGGAGGKLTALHSESQRGKFSTKEKELASFTLGV